MKMTEYLLKAHSIYAARKRELVSAVRSLKGSLPEKDFLCHPTVKLARWIVEADQFIIPLDPNHKDYSLKGVLKNYRRYKRGIQRYRLFFCFAQKPIAVIIYLYLNNEDTQRKDGDKKDPYYIFKKNVKKGVFVNDPNDPKMKKWIRELPSV